VSVCVWTRLGSHGKETVRNRPRREEEDPIVAQEASSTHEEAQEVKINRGAGEEEQEEQEQEQ
jgi:hypothetical protein